MSAKFRKFKFSEEHIGGGLFESITSGLYNRPLHVIREYVQNEIESDPQPSRIQVEIEERRLSIIGDGGGMDLENLTEAICVGISDKRPETHTGFRGIGIYSGVSIVREVLISTKKSGMDEWLLLKIDAEGIMKKLENREKVSLTKLLSDHTYIGSLPGNQDEQGTHVELIDIRDELLSGFKVGRIRDYMCETLPIEFSNSFPHSDNIHKRLRQHVTNYRCFEIFLNGEQVYRPPFISYLEDPQFEEIRANGNLIALVWSAINKNSERIPDERSRGFVFKQWNFAIGNKETTMPYWSQPFVAIWYFGEIHIMDPSIIADTQRTGFEASSMFNLLEEELNQYFKKLLSYARTKSDVKALESDLKKVKELAKSTSTLDSIDKKEDWLLETKKSIENLEKKKKKKTTTAGYKTEIEKIVEKLKKKRDTVQDDIPIQIGSSTKTSVLAGSKDVVSSDEEILDISKIIASSTLIDALRLLKIDTENAILLAKAVDNVIKEVLPSTQIKKKRMREAILKKFIDLLELSED